MLRPPDISFILFVSRGAKEQPSWFAQETQITAASEGQRRTRGTLRLLQPAT